MGRDNLLLYENITQCVTLAGVAKKKGRHITEEDLGIIENAAMVVDTDTNTILWVGKTSDTLPPEFRDIVNAASGEDEVWLPELVECHTHLVYAGHRQHDYALRVKGKSYQEIAAEGGGILSTLKHTREASLEDLIDNAEPELVRFQKYGVGCIEIKSGYGLSLDSEIKILECVQALQEGNNLTLVPTPWPPMAKLHPSSKDERMIT